MRNNNNVKAKATATNNGIMTAKTINETAAMFINGLEDTVNIAQKADNQAGATNTTETDKHSTAQQTAVKTQTVTANGTTTDISGNTLTATAYTPEVEKIITDTAAQIAQYNDTLPKKISIDFALMKNTKIPVNASEEVKAKYNEKQTARQTAIYEQINAYDEKLLKAEEKKTETATKASTPKLSKFEKAEVKFATLMDSTTAEESDILKLNIANNTYTVKALLQMFSDGSITIPTIQRGLVWSNEQIAKLYDSLLKNYPIPQLVVINNKLYDGQQRTNAIMRIVQYLSSKIPATVPTDKPTAEQIALDTIYGKFIPVMNVSGKLTSSQEIAVMDKLNNGTLYSKAVKVRNTMTANTIDNYSKIKAHSTLKQITAEARKQAINLDKQGQLDTLSTYILAISKAQKSIACDMATCKAITESAEYTAEDFKTIYNKLEQVSKVINGIETARANGKFIANIYNLNTLSSVIYAIFKLNTESDKITANLIKAYTSKDNKIKTAMQIDAWTKTTKSSGSSAENIKVRAEILNK